MVEESLFDWDKFWQKKGLNCQSNGVYVKGWEFCPEKNPVAKELATKILNKKGIQNVCIVEVAPALFWYQMNGKMEICSWIDIDSKMQCEEEGSEVSEK